MKILFAVCSIGLGHTTRSIPLIKELAKSHDVTVLSCGNALKLLKRNLRRSVHYINYPEVHIITWSPSAVFKAMQYFGNIFNEYNFTRNLIRKYKYQLIISDCRYGICSTTVPSFFITHQLRIMSPMRDKFAEDGLQFFNSVAGQNYVKFLVPDFKDEPSLTGDLSHNIKFIDNDKIEYLGPISWLENREFELDIDYLFIISGPEPYRSEFEKKVMDSISKLKGNIVIILSKFGSHRRKTIGNVRIINSCNGDEMSDLFSRSKMIISRSGYTSLMDAAITGKKALFVPTPLQTEQEYLADYHNKSKTFYSITQDKLNLASDVKMAEKCNGFKRKCSTEDTIKNFMAALKPYL